MKINPRINTLQSSKTTTQISIKIPHKIRGNRIFQSKVHHSINNIRINTNNIQISKEFKNKISPVHLSRLQALLNTSHINVDDIILSPTLSSDQINLNNGYTLPVHKLHVYWNKMDKNELCTISNHGHIQITDKTASASAIHKQMHPQDLKPIHNTLNKNQLPPAYIDGITHLLHSGISPQHLVLDLKYPKSKILKFGFISSGQDPKFMSLGNMNLKTNNVTVINPLDNHHWQLPLQDYTNKINHHLDIQTNDEWFRFSVWRDRQVPNLQLIKLILKHNSESVLIESKIDTLLKNSDLDITKITKTQLKMLRRVVKGTKELPLKSISLKLNDNSSIIDIGNQRGIKGEGVISVYTGTKMEGQLPIAHLHPIAGVFADKTQSSPDSYWRYLYTRQSDKYVFPLSGSIPTMDAKTKYAFSNMYKNASANDSVASILKTIGPPQFTLEYESALVSLQKAGIKIEDLAFQQQPNRVLTFSLTQEDTAPIGFVNTTYNSYIVDHCSQADLEAFKAANININAYTLEEYIKEYRNQNYLIHNDDTKTSQAMTRSVIGHLLQQRLESKKDFTPENQIRLILHNIPRKSKPHNKYILGLQQLQNADIPLSHFEFTTTDASNDLFFKLKNIDMLSIGSIDKETGIINILSPYQSPTHYQSEYSMRDFIKEYQQNHHHNRISATESLHTNIGYWLRKKLNILPNLDHYSQSEPVNSLPVDIIAKPKYETPILEHSMTLAQESTINRIIRKSRLSPDLFTIHSCDEKILKLQGSSNRNSVILKCPSNKQQPLVYIKSDGNTILPTSIIPESNIKPPAKVKKNKTSAKPKHTHVTYDDNIETFTKPIGPKYKESHGAGLRKLLRTGLRASDIKFTKQTSEQKEKQQLPFRLKKDTPGNIIGHVNKDGTIDIFDNLYSPLFPNNVDPNLNKYTIRDLIVKYNQNQLSNNDHKRVPKLIQESLQKHVHNQNIIEQILNTSDNIVPQLTSAQINSLIHFVTQTKISPDIIKILPGIRITIIDKSTNNKYASITPNGIIKADSTATAKIKKHFPIEESVLTQKYYEHQNILDTIKTQLIDINYKIASIHLDDLNIDELYIANNIIPIYESLKDARTQLYKIVDASNNYTHLQSSTKLRTSIDQSITNLSTAAMPQIKRFVNETLEYWTFENLDLCDDLELLQRYKKSLDIATVLVHNAQRFENSTQKNLLHQISIETNKIQGIYTKEQYEKLENDLKIYDNLSEDKQTEIRTTLKTLSTNYYNQINNWARHVYLTKESATLLFNKINKYAIKILTDRCDILTKSINKSEPASLDEQNRMQANIHIFQQELLNYGKLTDIHQTPELGEYKALTETIEDHLYTIETNKLAIQYKELIETLLTSTQEKSYNLDQLITLQGKVKNKLKAPEEQSSVQAMLIQDLYTSLSNIIEDLRDNQNRVTDVLKLHQIDPFLDSTNEKIPLNTFDRVSKSNNVQEKKPPEGLWSKLKTLLFNK